MNKILIIVSLVLATFGLANAQEFKEGLLYDLTGNVKDMKLTTKSPFPTKHVKFRENGKCKKTMTFFDDENYPLGYDISSNFMNFGLSKKVKYDDLRRIESITEKSSMYGNGTTTSINYYIDEEIPSQVGRTIFTVNNKDYDMTVECNYSDYVYDDHGNWTSRLVKQNASMTDKKGKTKDASDEYTETRKIKYF